MPCGEENQGAGYMQWLASENFTLALSQTGKLLCAESMIMKMLEFVRDDMPEELHVRAKAPFSD